MPNRRAAARAASATFVVMVVAACGGTSLSDVLAGAAPIDGGVGKDGASSSEGGSSDASASDARATDGNTTEASAPKDATADVSKRIDLACPANGTQTCDLRTEACCRGIQGFECRLQKDQCPGLRLPCAQASDCEFRAPGTVCCGTVNNDSRVVQVTCEKPDNCVTPQRVIICNPNDSDPCPIEGQCTESQGTLLGYYLCL